LQDVGKQQSTDIYLPFLSILTCQWTFQVIQVLQHAGVGKIDRTGSILEHLQKLITMDTIYAFAFYQGKKLEKPNRFLLVLICANLKVEEA
jgi:hypothetical protein